MILDTSLVIDHIRRDIDIKDNVSIVSLIDDSPLKEYGKFRGRVYFITEEDHLLAILLQDILRRLGKPLSVGDLLIAAISINRNEVLRTKDKFFIGL